LAPTRKDALAELLWTEHRARFAKSLREITALNPEVARGIAGAYYEMVDNIVEHAAVPGDPLPRGLVGFVVDERGFSFSVADLGRGVLASLHDLERHRSIETHHDALDAAIRRGASRRGYSAAGGGFSCLHQALADMHCVLRFRSGDAALVLDGRGADRAARRALSPALPGFQLSVQCVLRRRA
jgi:hypothetical protein